ncbi:hypothetical protein [Polymorphobacter fuscus]|uniref:hypothetical protein n=1 Tax=Sandarakinorhabdus fusca TaxID=1439888 RepID=UPI00188323C7|nr:hypothetical protein [Polymorphobacter fuscus]
MTPKPIASGSAHRQSAQTWAADPRLSVVETLPSALAATPSTAVVVTAAVATADPAAPLAATLKPFHMPPAPPDGNARPTHPPLSAMLTPDTNAAGAKRRRHP